MECIVFQNGEVKQFQVSKSKCEIKAILFTIAYYSQKKKTV